MIEAAISETPVVIEMSSVTKKLGGKPVLRDLSLQVRKGEVFVILGRSGSGKSVTLKHIVGLLRPDQGTIRVLGREITPADSAGLEEVRRRIGFLFQSAALLGSLTVSENIALPLREHTRLGEGTIRQRVRQKLIQLDMEEAENAMPAELSGGMRKRAGLARALVLDPEILLYDEPTAGLDPIMATAINGLVLETKSRLGVTSVVVTHDIASAFRIADRMALLDQGQIAFSGPPDEFRSPSDARVSQFVQGELDGPLSRGRRGE